jgi:hypothetical protein
MSTNGDRPAEDGFEYQGEFYRWRTDSDLNGKDLMLIDRITGMPFNDYLAMTQDPVESGRTSVLLTMVALSMRAANPEWTVERIMRLMVDFKPDDFVTIDADTEADTLPPASADEPASTGEGSSSESKPTSSARTPATSATSSVTPA